MKNETLNLTPAFMIWTAIFGIIAVVTDNWSWLWVAAAPWLIVMAFFGFFIVGSVLTFAALYISGNPIKFTRTNRDGTKTVRYIQRKR